MKSVGSASFCSISLLIVAEYFAQKSLVLLRAKITGAFHIVGFEPIPGDWGS